MTGYINPTIQSGLTGLRIIYVNYVFERDELRDLTQSFHR